MEKRLFAFISQTFKDRRVQHFVGRPPELTAGQDKRVLLPIARLVLLQETGSGVYFYRFTADGAFCGETWHPNIKEALSQGNFEYDGSLGQWMEVPRGESDALKYALSQLRCAT
jgi:hypothetical protein